MPHLDNKIVMAYFGVWKQFRQQVLLTTLIKTRTSLDEPIRDQLSQITNSLLDAQSILPFWARIREANEFQR